ncbi:MAG: hypothetical protein G01um101456_611 [Parcubacteria group bacterium Gr01-1014_56]|nr:MAG: hypothetical protein G01um101456_611 [Parcubacteria group bacterium Gr01-1014_56]
MTFSIVESLKFGWEKTKQHSGLLFQVLLTLFALQVLYAMVSRVLEGSAIGFLAIVALMVAEFVVGVGLTLITLRIAQGKHVEYKDIVPPLQMLWQYALASALAGLIVLGGLILLIVPGIYFALRFSMVRFAVLEGEGVMGSLTKSSLLTQGVKWKLLGFLLIICLVNLLGAILFLVGLLLTIPVTTIAYAHVYQKLHARHRS